MFGTDTVKCGLKQVIMEKKIVITTNDYHRLLSLNEFASPKEKMPDSVARLYDALINARMLPQEAISRNVITMNSRVLLQDISSDRQAELTITYPQDADNRQRKVSVFSTIGTALLGKQVGNVVSWKTPAGDGRFEILKITYQPEAVGDYSL